MKIILANYDDYHDELRARSLPLSTTIQAFIRSVLDEAAAQEIKTIYFKIDKAMLSRSYIVNPAMFARSIYMHAPVPYPAINAVFQGNDILVGCSHNHIPTTFKGRVIRALKKRGEYTALRRNIPSSYRARPCMLSRILASDLNKPITVVANKRSITWTI